MTKNILYYGDNLDVLRRHIKDESIDLVYLDPPFKSNQDYNVLFAEQNGSKSKAQIKAFEDTWRWDQGAAAAYQEIVELGGKVSETMQAFEKFLGQTDMLAYLSMMAPRLTELQRKLKPTGSIYLHCDPTASHYLKMLMDAVFGKKNFINEVIWTYKTQGASKRHWSRKHDVLLFYAKSEQYTFNYQTERSYMQHKYGFKDDELKIDEEGRQYRDALMRDVWEISALQSATREKLGYPTQKPEALLERIIKASSNEGDIVLDPFCGCGTTIAVAQRLNRHWIGIDITHLAITLIKHRLHSAFEKRVSYEVIGEPVSLPDAETLAKQDPYQFQWWALGLVGARPVEQKKGSDKGIDGRLYFHDDPVSGKTKQIILSVKAGHTSVAHVRDLRGVIEREKAEIGVLISMEEPTKHMRTEAASSGFYDSPWGKRFPRLQILTVGGLLEGKGIEYPPPSQVNVTFKKAPKTQENEIAEQGKLSLKVKP